MSIAGDSAIIVPFPDVDDLVGEWRRPQSEPGLPAHVTLLYPFVPFDEISAEDVTAARVICGAAQALPVQFPQCGRFPGVSYLSPEPAGFFRSLTERLVERWPDHKPYGGAFDTIVPHLTVAHGLDARAMEDVEARITQRLPFRSWAEEAWLMRFDGERWICGAQLPFADVDPVVQTFLRGAGLTRRASLADVVEAVRSIPYARPTVRDAEHVVSEWRGTCSSKHSLLARVVECLWPELQVDVVHRVYRVLAEDVAAAEVRAVVPEAGIIDVHRFLTVTIDGRETTVDATFPGRPWDGRCSMAVACGAGVDHVASGDPDAHKSALELEFCDPRVREPFIAALAAHSAV